MSAYCMGVLMAERGVLGWCMGLRQWYAGEMS